MKEEVAGLSPYYLLIGRQSDPEGIFTKFWVDVKLPETGSFNPDCFIESARILLNSNMVFNMNRKYEDIGKDPNRYYEVEQSAMDSLVSYIGKLITCCDPEMRTSCDLCPDVLSIQKDFLSRGFGTFQMKVVGQSEGGLPIGQNTVEDFANFLVEVEGETLNLAEVLLEAFLADFFSSLSVKGLFTNDDSFCNENEGFLKALDIWENQDYDFIQWVHYSEALSPNGNSIVFVKIKENLLNVIDNLPAIDAFLAPPLDPNVPSHLFDLEEVKLVVLNIYQKNEINFLNISVSDKEPLNAHDLWLTVFWGVGPLGNSDISSSTLPPTTQKQDKGSWVNLWRIERGNENKNIEFYNYRMGYIAAHEFLHQILVKAYCYINTLENGDPFGFDVSTNPFRGGTHYNRRTNLLSDGNNIWNRPGFPEKRINKLIPEEVI
jgi:hypothetical protein